VPLADSKEEVLKHLHYLWQFDVKLVEDDANGNEICLNTCFNSKPTTEKEDA